MEPGIYEVIYATTMPPWMPRFFAFYEGSVKNTTHYELLVNSDDKYFFIRPPLGNTLEKPLKEVTMSDFLGPVSKRTLSGMKMVAPLEKIADELIYDTELEHSLLQNQNFK